MTTIPTKRLALEVSASAGLVIVAAFLPWGEVDFSKMPAPFGAEMGDGFNQMIASFGTVPVTVWNGHADIGGLKLPNVLVVLAAIAGTVAAWLKAISVWNARTAVFTAFAAYGLAHSCYVLVNLVVSAEGSAGFGVFLSTLGFTWMLFAVLRREKPRKPGIE
jgi:hypothetical protein